MNKILIFSKDKLRNLVYELNLRAYVNAQSTFVSNLEDLKDKISEKDFDLLVVTSSSSEIESFISTHSYKKILFIGKTNLQESDGLFILPNPYDLKSILQKIAQTFSITAKDMAEKDVGDYFRISKASLKYLEEDDFKFFMKLKDTYHPYKEDENLEKFVYVESSERLKVINKITISLLTRLDQADVTPSEKHQIAEMGMEIACESIFANNKITQEIIEISRECIKSINDVSKSVPKLSQVLKGLLDSKTSFLYVHCVLGAYVSEKIIDQMSWGNKEQKQKVSFAYFFHDMYLYPYFKKFPNVFNEEDFLLNENLSEEEKNHIIEHALLASTAVKTYPQAPFGVDMIIMQHHGMSNGQGFATVFKDNISPLAKVMIISEEIVIHLFNRLKNKTNPLIDYDELVPKLYEKFPNHTYKKLIAAFEKINLE